MPLFRSLVTHKVWPEHRETYEQATRALVQATGWEHGVMEMDWFREQADPNRYRMLTVYLDAERALEYRRSEPYLSWHQAVVVAGLLASPESHSELEYCQVFPPRDPACTPQAEVSLRPVSEDNLRAVIELAVHDHQRSFVASNDRSLMQAYAAGERAWVRAIYAGEVPVGFVMLSLDRQLPRYYLWRFMVDGRYQGLGYGRRGLSLVVEFVRTQPQASALFLSYAPGEGSPKAFYEAFGFRETGVQHGRELEMRLDLGEPAEGVQRGDE